MPPPEFEETVTAKKDIGDELFFNSVLFMSEQDNRSTPLLGEKEADEASSVAGSDATFEGDLDEQEWGLHESEDDNDFPYARDSRASSSSAAAPESQQPS